MPFPLRYVFQIGLVAAIYYLLAWLGLSFSMANPVVSPMWPPSGFALSILLFRLSLWPAVTLGAFAANYFIGSTGLLVSLGIGIGNGLEAVVGAYLISRLAEPKKILVTVVDTSKFILFGPILSTAVSATIGNLSLMLGGLAPKSELFSLWFTWWVGDSVGDLVFAPFFVALLLHREARETWSRQLEKMGLLAITALTAGYVFLDWFAQAVPSFFPGPYIVVPLLILGALRAGPLIQTTQALIVALMAASGAALGSGVFSGVAPEATAVEVQAFLGIITVTTLFLRAGITETKNTNAALGKEIEARIRSEKELRESHSRFLQLADNVREIFYVTDLGKPNVLYVNRAYEAIFGRKCSELYEHPLSYLDAVHPADRSMMEEDMEKQIRGELQSKEFRIICPDGRIKWVWKRAYPVFNEHGDLQRVVGVAEDITERKEVEEKLRNQASQLLRSNSELEYFASTASHDLKAPLRMITSYVQLLAARYKGRLDPDADDYIRFAVDGTKRMSLLIDDLLEYSRSGLNPSPKETASLNPVVKRVLTDLKPFVEESEAIVTYGDLPDVRGSSAQLGLVFQNLVANALKYTRKGVKPQVHIGGEKKNGEWILSVKDNGVGIEPEDREKVFGIFQRLHTEKGIAGSGIGLATCKRVVERLGGRIWVESEPGAGSTFYFAIPVEQQRNIPSVGSNAFAL